MLDWDSQQDEVAARIRAERRDFRIILKTKDETHFLKDWVAHHRRLAGDAGLVIFDNGSTDPAVLDYYDTIADRILVVRFTAYMNTLHRPYLMPALYAALRASTRYFTFIDSDEFLYWFTAGGDCLSGQGFLANLLARNERLIPGLWLEDLAGYRDRLWLDEARRPLGAALRSGKPILSADVEWDGMSNHNFHLPPALWLGSKTGNLVVAHLTNLYPSQRIKANIAKLRSDGVLGAEATLQDVLALDIADLSGTTRQYVREIQSLAHKPVAPGDPAAPLPRGSVQIDAGKLVFPDIAARDAFNAFLADSAPLIRSFLCAQAEPALT